ncbi:MAG: SDR family NAD(P)-dependent oxidoreductase [Myxococcota bacterium]
MTPATTLECEGRIALVTGASRGIGAAIAERLASAGAQVGICARSLDRSPEGMRGTLEECAGRIEARGGRARAFVADIAKAEDRERLMTECERDLGPVDILVNNAAFGPYRPSTEFSARTFTLTLEVNVRAAMHLSSLALPGMCERGRGWIVNISSATAKHPQGPPYNDWERVGGHHLYAASKAALDRISTGMAAEFHHRGVAINALAPVAAVITPGVEALGIGAFIDESMVEPIEAMAEAALLLAHCDPQALTGRVHYSLELLEEFERTPRNLDGSPR